MISEKLGTVGNWSGRLHPDTPDSVLDLIEPFGHIIITAGDVGPGVLNGNNILGQSIYTGVVSPREADNTILGGYGLPWWLGPISDVTESSITTSELTAAALIDTYVLLNADDCNGITPGDITASATTRTIKIEPGMDRLQVLALICRVFGLGWRINPDGTLDVDTSANLWSTTPTAIVTPKWGGRDRNITGWRADIRLADDVDDYRTRWVVKPETGANQDATITTPYYGLTGNLIVREGYTDASSSAPGTTQAAAIAAQQLGRFDDVREQIEVDLLDANQPRTEIGPGDWLYAWNPRRGIVGAGRVHYRGHLLDPAPLRVFEVEWPIERGHGVYYRAPDSGGTIVRLTDHWLWETGPTRLVVGAGRRTFNTNAWAA